MPIPQSSGADSSAQQHIYDVFLSHHSGDKPQVEALAVRLEDEEGLKPFLDKWHLIPGEPWEEALEEALDRSRTCAVFLGESGLGAWENEEMRAALDERARNNSFRVIPVLLPAAEPKDEKTLPRFLRRLTWVDFRGGIDDPETFRRLVAGIRGVAPDRQYEQPNSAISSAQSAGRPPRRFRDVFSSIFAGGGKSRAELWKIVLPAMLALLFSTPFISAAIPRYKLQIKSPAFRKEGVYEAPAGTVLIKWGVTKEQWFRETDVSDIRANLIISKSGGEVEASLQNQLGEARTSLKPGRYEVRIDAVAYQRIETIALQITTPALSAATETETMIEKPPPTPLPVPVNTPGVSTQSPISVSTTAAPKHTATPMIAAPDPTTSQRLRAQKSGRALILVEEIVGGGSKKDNTIAQALSQRLVENGLSVTMGSEIGPSELTRLRSALQKLQLGDRTAGGSIPFAVVVTGTVSVASPEIFEGLYGARATGSLWATATSDGRTIASERISGARGFGNGQDESLKNTFRKAGESISESFIRQISANAR
jgi:hypothetical protein